MYSAFYCGGHRYLAFVFLLKNETSAIWAWLGTMIGATVIVSMLAMKFEFFQWLNGWLIFNMLGGSFDEETGLYLFFWQQAGGMMRMVTAGILGTLVFLAVGMIGARNRNK